MAAKEKTKTLAYLRTSSVANVGEPCSRAPHFEEAQGGDTGEGDFSPL